MTTGIWPSQRIRRAIQEDILCLAAPIAPRQIQPASIDLRLGEIAYRVPASFMPGSGRRVSERLAMLSTHEVDLKKPAVLERNCVHVIPLMECLNLPRNVEARANPKSSTGRLDLFVRIISDYATSFDDIPAGYSGPLYAEVVPRSFPIIARQGDTLAQLRFRDLPHPPKAWRNETVCVDLDPAGKPDGIIGYRARKHSGLIDLSRIGGYRTADYWEPIVGDALRKELVLDPEEFYILASSHPVRATADEAAEMIAYDTALAEARFHAAGFVDPFFEGRLVLEVRAHDVPFLMTHNQKIGNIIYERMAETPDTLYGEGIGSNYQGQQVKLSKHFAD